MKYLINIENYEQYAMDFVDGQMAPELQEAFEQFLMAHPEIAIELEGLSDAVLESENTTAPSFDAKSLKMDIAPVGGINESNYEEFFVNEVEGNLNAEQLQVLNQFIDSNPALAADRALYQRTRLEADLTINYDGESLAAENQAAAITAFDGIDEANYEEFFIDEAEGNLSAEQLLALNQFITSNSALAADRELYQSTRLKADQSIVYQGESLKKAIPLWQFTENTAFRVAAGLALLIGIGSILFQLDEQSYQERAGAAGFAAIETPVETNKKAKSLDELTEANYEEVLLAEAVPAERQASSKSLKRTDINRIQSRKVNFQADRSADLALRDDAPMESELMAWVETPSFGSAKELTVPQFLGREVLGKDPELSAKEFALDEVKKVAENSGLVATSNSSSKRTFQLFAGAFEIKRINYKN